MLMSNRTQKIEIKNSSLTREIALLRTKESERNEKFPAKAVREETENRCRKYVLYKIEWQMPIGTLHFSWRKICSESRSIFHT
jgi:hypothetical protein